MIRIFIYIFGKTCEIFNDTKSWQSLTRRFSNKKKNTSV